MQVHAVFRNAKLFLPIIYNLVTYSVAFEQIDFIGGIICNKPHMYSVVHKNVARPNDVDNKYNLMLKKNSAIKLYPAGNLLLDFAPMPSGLLPDDAVQR